MPGLVTCTEGLMAHECKASGREPTCELVNNVADAFLSSAAGCAPHGMIKTITRDQGQKLLRAAMWIVQPASTVLCSIIW